MDKSTWRPAQDDWDKDNTTRINLKFNNRTDKDILDAIDMNNKQGSIKELLRKAIAIDNKTKK